MTIAPPKCSRCGSSNVREVGTTASTRGSHRFTCDDCNGTTLVVAYDGPQQTQTGGR